MRKMWIRVLAIVLNITLLFGVFSSCGKNKDENAAANAGASTTTSTTLTTTTTQDVTDPTSSSETTTSSKAGDTSSTKSQKTKSSTTTKKSAVSSSGDKLNGVSIDMSKFGGSGKSSVNAIKNAKVIYRWGVKDKNTQVLIEKVQLKLNVYEGGVKTEKTVNRNVYIALIEATPAHVYDVAASQLLGSIATTEKMAKSFGALFAVANEMCNHNKQETNAFYNAADDSKNATVIKNRAVVQKGAPSPSLLMYSNGKWEYPHYVNTANTKDLLSKGVVSSVSYTYPVIWEGKPYYIEGGSVKAPMWSEFSTVQSNQAKKFYNDHVLIGQVDANHYVITISEGFGRGYLCDLMMNNLGVQNAFWANGGHCATMYVKGYGIINRPNDPTPCIAADILAIK